MKTPKKPGSPNQKLNMSFGGQMKTAGVMKKKKLSLMTPEHAWKAVKDNEAFTVRSKTPSKQNGIKLLKVVKCPMKKPKKSLPQTPEVKVKPSTNQDDSTSKKNRKRKSSIGGGDTKSPDVSNSNKPKKEKASPEVKLGLKIEKLLDKSPQDSSKNNTPTSKKKQNVSKALNTPPSGGFLHQLTVFNAVKALIKNVENSRGKQILDDTVHFRLTVNFAQVPAATNGVIRVNLPHSLNTDTADVGLIVCDFKGRKNDPDEAIDVYKELLSNAGIKLQIEIIPYHKLRTEYTQIEQQRKFVNRFDHILIDARLARRVYSVIRRGILKKKLPVAVKLGNKNKLKQQFDSAFKKTSFVLQSTSLTISAKFGHSGLSPNELTDNILAMARVLADTTIFSSGVDNIKSLFIAANNVPSLPIYISNISPNDVKPEKIEKKSPKFGAVTDEITTCPNTSVTVYPDGRIKTKKLKNEFENEDKESFNDSNFDLILQNSDESDEETDDDESDFELDSEDDDNSFQETKHTKNEKNFNSKHDDIKEDSDDSSGDDTEIEEAEQNFLKELRKQQDKLNEEKTTEKIVKPQQKPKQQKMPKQQQKPKLQQTPKQQPSPKLQQTPKQQQKPKLQQTPKQQQQTPKQQQQTPKQQPSPKLQQTPKQQQKSKQQPKPVSSPKKEAKKNKPEMKKLSQQKKQSIKDAPQVKSKKNGQAPNSNTKKNQQSPKNNLKGNNKQRYFSTG